jgi:hypothetical protein
MSYRNRLCFAIGYFSLLCLLLSSITLVLGEESPIWNKTYGGISDDDCFSVLKANDGGYILAGDTASFGAGETDVWLIKTDINGNMEWNKTYGGTASDDMQFMIADDDGYIIAGRTYSFGEGDADLWLIKTDFNGNVIWNRTYGGPQTEWCWSIVKTSDNGYALLGRFNSYDEGNNDFWLIKTDSEGLLDWEKTIGDIGDERGRSLVNTADGGFLLLGWTNSSGALGIDFWLVKTDEYGNPQWNKTYGGEAGDRGKVIVKTEDNGYLIGGSTTSFGAGDNDVWLVRIDSAGNHIWNKTYGGQERETVESMLVTDDGGYAFVGYTYSFGAGDQDVWFVKTDSAGNVQWNQTYGEAAYEGAHSLLRTDEGGYLLAGFSASYGLGGTDVFLIKTDAQGIIPEFSSWRIIALFLATTFVVVLYRNRLRDKG